MWYVFNFLFKKNLENKNDLSGTFLSSENGHNNFWWVLKKLFLLNWEFSVNDSRSIGFKKWFETKLFFIILNNSFFKYNNFIYCCVSLKRDLFTTNYPKLWADELTWEILPNLRI